MSIPAKGSRVLEVQGIKYHWRVRRRPTPDQRTGRTPLLLAVARADGQGASLLVRLCGAHPSNRASLRGTAVTPGVVAEWMRLAMGAGWRPHEPGKQFLFEGRGPAGMRTAPQTLRAPTREDLRRLAEREHRDHFRLDPSTGHIHINGTDLVDLVHAVESPFILESLRHDDPRIDVSLEQLAPGYIHLPAGELFLPSRALIDEPQNTAGRGFLIDANDPRRNKATVLECACGITECWFLLVQITVLDDVVTWSDFEQFHRDWVYDLGPFVFDGAAYFGQLTR